MSTITTIEDLRQHALVILRRLRSGPLTEFELASEVAEHSGYSVDHAADLMSSWLDDLRNEGFIWSGKLYNHAGQCINAAALTGEGRKLVG